MKKTIAKMSTRDKLFLITLLLVIIPMSLSLSDLFMETTGLTEYDMAVFTLLLFCGWMVLLFILAIVVMVKTEVKASKERKTLHVGDPVHYSNPAGIDGVITNIEGEIITLSVKVTRSMLYKDDAKSKV
jgi:preprotein translocase subunit YajC